MTRRLRAGQRGELGGRGLLGGGDGQVERLGQPDGRGHRVGHELLERVEAERGQHLGLLDLVGADVAVGEGGRRSPVGGRLGVLLLGQVGHRGLLGRAGSTSPLSWDLRASPRGACTVGEVADHLLSSVAWSCGPGA